MLTAWQLFLSHRAYLPVIADCVSAFIGSAPIIPILAFSTRCWVGRKWLFTLLAKPALIFAHVGDGHTNGDLLAGLQSACRIPKRQPLTVPTPGASFEHHRATDDSVILQPDR